MLTPRSRARAPPQAQAPGAAMADPAASYLGPSSATNEWIETVEEDERFLPTFQGDASLIKEGLWLGSEENVRDLVWLKVEKITRIVTIMPYPVDPTDSGDVSETLKLWYADNVEALFLEVAAARGFRGRGGAAAARETVARGGERETPSRRRRPRRETPSCHRRGEGDHRAAASETTAPRRQRARDPLAPPWRGTPARARRRRAAVAPPPQDRRAAAAARRAPRSSRGSKPRSRDAGARHADPTRTRGRPVLSSRVPPFTPVLL